MIYHQIYSNFYSITFDLFIHTVHLSCRLYFCHLKLLALYLRIGICIWPPVADPEGGAGGALPVQGPENKQKYHIWTEICSRTLYLRPQISKFSGEACPRTPLEHTRLAVVCINSYKNRRTPPRLSIPGSATGLTLVLYLAAPWYFCIWTHLLDDRVVRQICEHVIIIIHT